MRRRIAGVVSYECGERLGQRLLQVSLLAVRIRYQRLGVASRLSFGLASEPPTPETADEPPPSPPPAASA